MIYDCFTFFNELDLLDIRLHELDDFVDKFVIVESTVTFTNIKKPLLYELNKSRFKSFHKKIIHIVVEDSPNVLGNPWIIEMHQFNAIARGLNNCKNDDTVLLSNVDEIPNKSAAKDWMFRPDEVKAFEQILFYYYLNLRVINQKWIGTRMLKFSNLKDFPNLYVLRHSPIDL